MKRICRTSEEEVEVLPKLQVADKPRSGNDLVDVEAQSKDIDLLIRPKR